MQSKSTDATYCGGHTPSSVSDLREMTHDEASGEGHHSKLHVQDELDGNGTNLAIHITIIIIYCHDKLKLHPYFHT